MLVFDKRVKSENPEKNTRGRVGIETQQNLPIHYDAGCGNCENSTTLPS